MTTTLKDILLTIPKLSEDDLRTINGAVVTILRSDRKKRIAIKKGSLSIGDKVWFRGKYGVREDGTITKINRTRCVIDTGSYRNWTVPMTMLNHVSGNEGV